MYYVSGKFIASDRIRIFIAAGRGFERQDLFAVGLLVIYCLPGLFGLGFGVSVVCVSGCRIVTAFPSADKARCRFKMDSILERKNNNKLMCKCL